MDKLLLGILAMLLVVVISNPTANPIANMYGPLFLLFYAFVIVVTLIVCGWGMQGDSTAKLPLPSVPTNPDPYEIAYLRGGENEVTRLAVFDLIQRRYLEIDGKNLKQPLSRPDVNTLTSIEREVLDGFLYSRKASEIFQSSLPGKVKQHCTVYEQRLQNEQLLFPNTSKQFVKRLCFIGTLIILGLGGYKLIAALATGHSNVMFLVIIGIFSQIILLCVCQTPRLSQRGKAYLQRLQNTFEGLKKQVSTVQLNATDSNILLPLAVFGISILVGSPYAEFEKMFHVAAANASTSFSGGVSSCGSGSSCGGGDGGGGGCGGGCGGCGGG
ncbi:TIGR04222 domain-containing membrane protein [Nostoc sp. CENA67]|uniref:TIGR04222 domain-containing membrane protein n=1 Tax=Amazonocrinis nigriterrae CENA67 TaxID=2794033 RepID=A0A8J7HN43_9NOST|nr:TIGR04222 domain-containing membrane protein [Amazonocrinis nigriterrae]MBH8562347.1 TIGR04222 domain-containing membrane protein [Amazonocrinis nigriterrae CENA67]